MTIQTIDVTDDTDPDTNALAGFVGLLLSPSFVVCHNFLFLHQLLQTVVGGCCLLCLASQHCRLVHLFLL